MSIILNIDAPLAAADVKNPARKDDAQSKHTLEIIDGQALSEGAEAYPRNKGARGILPFGRSTTYDRSRVSHIRIRSF